MTLKEAIAATLAGETITVTTLRELGYVLKFGEFQFGEDGYTRENATEWIGALRSLRTRLEQLEQSEQPPVDDAFVAAQFEIADLEERAQDAEDRERYGLASQLRAKARALKERKR
jgi:hypothetical protein